jgi:hypothetical protein
MDGAPGTRHQSVRQGPGLKPLPLAYDHSGA